MALLDTSIHDDLVDYTQGLVESFDQRVIAFENTLDPALTELASLIQNSSSLRKQELDGSTHQVLQAFRSGQQQVERHQSEVLDFWRDLRQLFLSHRTLVIQTRQDLSDLIKFKRRSLKITGKWNSRQIEKFKKQFDRRLAYISDAVDGTFDQQSKLEQGFRGSIGENVDKMTDVVLTRISLLEGVSKDVFSQLKLSLDESRQQFADVESAWKTHVDSARLLLSEQIEQYKQLIIQSQQDLQNNLEKKISALDQSYTIFGQAIEQFKVDSSQHMGNALKRFNEDLNKQLVVRSQTLLDNIAALTAAQKGNWKEVLDAAHKGAEEAGKLLQPLLHKALLRDVSSMAKAQSDTFADLVAETRDKLRLAISRKISPWPQRIFLAGLLLCTFAIIISTFRYQSWTKKVLSSQRLELNQTSDELKQQLVQDIDELRYLLAQESLGETGIDKSAKPIGNHIGAIDRGSVGSKKYALTFDAGSNNRGTLEILEILKSHGLVSTLFITGEFVERFPDLVRQMVRDGHEIGNHLFKHEYLADPKTRKSLYSKEQLMSELKQVEDVFFQATGAYMKKLWRAPYGVINADIIQWTVEQGYTHIGWTRSGSLTLDTLDWVANKNSPLYSTAEQIVDKVLSFDDKAPHGLRGGIVLMHLGSDRPFDEMVYPHLPALISQLIQRGYQAVAVSDLL